MRRSVWATVALTAVLGTAVAATAPAQAVQPTTHSVVVSAKPSALTPHVLDGRMQMFAEVGDTVVGVGSFTTVRAATNSTNLARTNIFAFNPNTGAISSTFTPVVAADREVYDVVPAADGTSVYVSGQFPTVNGQAGTSRLARLDLATGQVISSFVSPGFDGIVKQVVLKGDKLYVGGSFTTAGGQPRTSLAVLDATTGALLPDVNVTFAGPRNNGALQVLKFDITPDGSRLVAIGNFTVVNGQSRTQIVQLDLGATSATVANWATSGFVRNTNANFDSYMRDVDYSQDGSFFAVATTGSAQGGYNQASLSDTLSRWETNATGTAVTPTWVDYTGGDTLLSVAVSGTAVYAGGHNRWLNNPYGSDSAGAGAVSRPGISAVDPKNGVPFTWNPTRTLGEGVRALLVTGRGLWIGSDTEQLAGEYHARVGLMPLAGGTAVPAWNAGTLPGDVLTLGKPTGTFITTWTDDVTRRTFSGTSVTASATSAAAAERWRDARGAFMINGVLYTGWSDGTLKRRTYDGTTFGAVTNVPLNNDSAFSSDLRNVTGMTFDAATNRLYYTINSTLSGNRLYYRYFNPESQIVGAVRFQGPGQVADLNWSQVSGLFVVGNQLFVASSNDGRLRRYGWDAAAGTPTAANGVVVSGTAADFKGRASFLLAGAAAPPVNQAPTARITSSCTGLVCTFSGSGSTDPDGSVAGYAWTFGDGGTSTATAPTRTYAAAGTYPVTLTVTDDRGATAQATAPVTVAPVPTGVAFRGATSSDANTNRATVGLPTSVRAGDRLILVATLNVSTTTATAPAGWTEVATADNNGTKSITYTKVATATDPGAAVAVALDATTKTSLQVLAYSGASGLTATSRTETASSASHPTPTATATVDGSYVVSYWSDKSSTTTAWTVPAGQTVRSATTGVGSGRITSVVSDAASGSAAGPVGGLTATADAASGKAITWTFVLPPA